MKEQNNRIGLNRVRRVCREAVAQGCMKLCIVPQLEEVGIRKCIHFRHSELATDGLERPLPGVGTGRCRVH